ncbi:ATPase, E1-E2 type (plasmid) [Trichormus variabilis ATCC 29413]|uniref:ATPase, E1-E2 type n=2 Tax=Anabaena variabilis TaxID=264691 RepID=Q3M2G8_TRIV2|nr:MULTISPECIES: cation-transporting P-type ATPase [Nostocaceae]ABA24818.1 ATPase, E1-E2 type [Trichormus variabilis ATCC 29413]MBC1270636.1 cation-transporting P-type ATPase [Trichormus variabilis FSR]MBC1305490.1 cation-transporting P-type ATPase [Trichormus variabilis N2B]MBD2382462.1 cation-transporting P-type ATPase [Trichormus variabilis FACHB-319]QFZ13547.1 cation-transporting P-type ATPase [Anabaena sp. YBS01]
MSANLSHPQIPQPFESRSWHTIEAQKTLWLLKSDRTHGLTQEQIDENLQHYGTNELVEISGRSPWEIFWDQFKNIMLLMLIAVAIISMLLDVRESLVKGQFIFPKDAVAIFAVVLLNGLLGYLQESGAEKALAALKNMASSKVRLIREGKVVEAESKELVPGDIMLLEAGVKVAADGRILEAANLQVREAALTGEAHAVEKQANAILQEDAPLGDRINLVFSGTEVVQGRATVVVTSTGMQTELGKIATALQSVETEPTPLQKRMAQLGNTLVTGSLIIVAIVILGGTLFNPSLFEELVKVSLSMAVAVVPEGLPAVITVTLALGTQRMVKRNALIRKLPAVETLGSVTTICSDKTGTLTQNKMVVQAVHTASYAIRVTGEGYSSEGAFYQQANTGVGQEIVVEAVPELRSLLLACVLCNDAVLHKENGDWAILGDPTEGALLAVAGKGGFRKDQEEQTFSRIAEFPFSSERKRMSVVVQDTSNQLGESVFIMFTKGSPELVLQLCTHIQQSDGSQMITTQQQQQILEQNNQLASQGLRVLGFARKNVTKLSDRDFEDTAETHLTWLGLAGMLDAPRPEVRDAVAKCRTAGIRTVMITGDHQLTAQAIAQDLGIAKVGDRSLTGQELQKLTQPELEVQVQQVSVYARVTPEHKLRIVQALQSQGQIVAMTGDGVNDAPALKQADIGVAMGITGTDVSKEASDMVLLDDNFATIVSAVEEGRVVYINIRRFIRYILGSNIGEVLTIAAAPLLGLGGVPLSPLQILWMNLVTDGLPALALAVEPGRPIVMQQPPKDPKESIFARGLGSYMARIGIILAVITILMMVWAYDYTAQLQSELLDRDRWQTMVFTTLCLAQMGHALAIRSNTRLMLEVNPFSNPYVVLSVTVTSILQLMLIYVEPLRSFFNTHYLSGLELLVCIGFSSLVFVWIEAEKLFIRWYTFRKYSKI